jgi:hypothetical protein
MEANYSIGRQVEIKPAYSMDTGTRSIWDEIAGCCGWITGVRGDYVMVQIKNGDEVEVFCQRIRFVGGC